jgi:hypothetical protein
MISHIRWMGDRVEAGRLHNSLDRGRGLRSRERTRRVPDEVVDRELSRSLPDNTESIANCQDARDAGRRGDLIRKRSDREGIILILAHRCAPRRI